jgi:glycine cleavage system P protein (glycine dehydrogenase) subunit 1
MPYTPHTEADIRTMLETLGLESLDDLFRTLPDDVKVDGSLDLPGALSEEDVRRVMTGFSAQNKGQDRYVSFMGGGVYDGLICAATNAITSRSEFLTAYTPYQAEVSQGTLQAIYEWQTYITRLTGLPVSNASMYDGATALVEGVQMALAKTRRGVVVVPETLNPNYLAVLRTSMQGAGKEIRIVPATDGLTTAEALGAVLDKDTGAVVVQSPNYLGLVETCADLAATAHDAGALVVACVNPVSLSILQSPAACGADIAVGEAQSLGIPCSWGGPLLGFMACSDGLKRSIPGRVVGRTTDHDGREGYVLTLQTREQHIRREKATSNICSNQGLNMLRATVHMAMLGSIGFRELGDANHLRALALRRELAEIDGVEFPHGDAIFNEFVIRLPRNASDFLEFARERELLAGIAVDGVAGCGPNDLLVAVTEKRTVGDIELYTDVLREFLEA